MEYTISGHTKLIALLGSPVAHSMSPAIHNEAFKELGLDYSYMAFDIGEEMLEKVVDAFRSMNVRGMNLTMPLKNKMAGLCDVLSPEAGICGAVNTVVNDNGVMTGYNTDGTGLLKSVSRHGFEVAGKTVAVFGTGGAAVSIIVQAALSGASHAIVFCRDDSRFRSRTEEIIARLEKESSCRISLCPYEEKTMREMMSRADLLVNATRVGMLPDAEGCLVPDTSFFHKGMIVADAVYEPRRTKLVEMASAAGCTAIGGLDMLLYQGEAAFRLWTGQEMPVAAIRKKIFSDTL